MSRSGLKASITPLICALLFMWLGLCMAMYSESRSPFDELQLLRNAETASATFVDLYERDYDEGATQTGGVYAFRVPGRNEAFFATTDSSMSYSARPAVQVEYSPDDPSINRVQGEGIRTIFEWSWRFALRLVVLGFFLPVVWQFLKQARDEWLGKESGRPTVGRAEADSKEAGS